MNKKYLKVIIIAVIWIIALLLTYFIAKPKDTKNNNESNPEEVSVNNKEEKEEQIVYKGTGIYDMYDENDLSIEYITVDDSDYFKISGLKDTELQDKINSRIKDTFYELKHKIKNPKKGSVSTFLHANFGDILSIEFFAYESDKNDKIILEQYKYINISLKDGSDIDLYDLFTKKDIVNSILTREFSTELYGNIKENGKTSSTKNNDKVEDQVFTIINKMKNGYKNFYVSNYYVSVSYGKYTIFIKFDKYRDYLAFPTKFKSDTSLYKDTNIGLKTLLFSDYFSEIDSAYVKHEFSGDNLFIDAVINNYLEPKSTSYRNKYIGYFNVDKIIDKYKKNINTNEFTYINSYGTLNGDEYGEVKDMKHVELILNTQVCTMQKNYFNKNIKEIIFTGKNPTMGEINNTLYLDYNKNVKCTKYLDSFVTDKNGNEISKLSDVFKTGYNYQKILDEAMNEYLMENEIEDEKAKQNIEYSIGLDGIYISNKYFDNLLVEYDKFDKKGLNW